MKLHKGIYGFETSSNKTPFGFLNEQQRVDAVVKNGGWFNYCGDKIGRGDLNMADLAKIAKSIPGGEAFFVLSEVDSIWDMPSGLDRSAPGIDYILKTATWLISKSTGVVRARDDISKGDIGDSSGVRYSRIPRKELVSSFGSTSKTSATKTIPAAKDTVADPFGGQATAGKPLRGYTPWSSGASKPKPTAGVAKIP